VAVIAVGGNALIQDSRHASFEDQRQRMEAASVQVVDLIAAGWSVVLVHGNGPQVGFSMQRSELARSNVDPVPMDAAVAETQGTMGYAFQQCIGNLLRQRNLSTGTVSLITQVEVDVDDPAFQHPTKPVGAFMDEATAQHRREQDAWQVMEDAGRGWRRVVASPRPVEIVEWDLLEKLVRAGACVVCAGGGGVPVVRTALGYRGVAAVIDKDLTSSLLAQRLRADLLLISTGVEKVCLHFGTPQQQELSRLTASQARQHLLEGHFKVGSMKPKIDAGLAFVESTGGRIVITDAPNIARAVAGETGTEILPD
jgi:carbamate kinase